MNPKRFRGAISPVWLIANDPEMSIVCKGPTTLTFFGEDATPIAIGSNFARRINHSTPAESVAHRRGFYPLHFDRGLELLGKQRKEFVKSEGPHGPIEREANGSFDVRGTQSIFTPPGAKEFQRPLSWEKT